MRRPRFSHTPTPYILDILLLSLTIGISDGVYNIKLGINHTLSATSVVEILLLRLISGTRKIAMQM
jgi:hypothetical protein